MTTDLESRLHLACVAACSCMTKTDYPEHHNPMCRYRLFQEAATEIGRLRAEVESLRPSCVVTNLTMKEDGSYAFVLNSDGTYTDLNKER